MAHLMKIASALRTITPRIAPAVIQKKSTPMIERTPIRIGNGPWQGTEHPPMRIGAPKNQPLRDLVPR